MKSSLLWFTRCDLKGETFPPHIWRWKKEKKRKRKKILAYNSFCFPFNLVSNLKYAQEEIIRIDKLHLSIITLSFYFIFFLVSFWMTWRKCIKTFCILIFLLFHSRRYLEIEKKVELCSLSPVHTHFSLIPLHESSLEID